jgi:hypothetical protein
MELIEIISENMLHMRACVHESVETEHVAASLPPSGTSYGWQLYDGTEAEPEVLCADFPDRRHILFEC